ncbi:hypothetical protein VNO78_25880 [Psophocarpus tetragonolobus]|uniref:PPM-type phosphatase domain-containing protein n=1 Tax=Psophocarpus tetragonolobus TaxID=3891 RepID=A0AAN9XFU3_PSOTE
MGNHIGKACLCSAGDTSRRHDPNIGNSICYVRPPELFSGGGVTTFRSVSGASVSANSSTPPSTTFDSLHSGVVLDSSASFESSPSFTSARPAQNGSRGGGSSAGRCNLVWWSPAARGFCSGPVGVGDLVNERGLEKKMRRSFSHDDGFGFGEKKSKKQSVGKKILKRVVSFGGNKKRKNEKNETCNIGENNNDDDNNVNVKLSCNLSLYDDNNCNDNHNNDHDYMIQIVIGDGDDKNDHNYMNHVRCNGGDHGDSDEKFDIFENCKLLRSQYCCNDLKNLDIVASIAGVDRDLTMECENLEWAQGRAGEDRVHIVISEEHGWVFVGIYDGFNGPDATDYLLDNLFYAVYDELKGLLCGHKGNEFLGLEGKMLLGLVKGSDGSSKLRNRMVNGCGSLVLDKENYPPGNEKENLDSLKLELNVKCASNYSHSDVLLALSEALKKIEDSFLSKVDEVIGNNPVLTMMGSCVLVMLMKGEDVYLMNVGDSRAVLATHSGNSLQLTMEHSTVVKEEVHRIRKEHPDDPFAITKGRVKGYLNITRAFGAGFLKKPKQNNAVLETFKINYIGDSPYITCSPSLYHHRLSPSDRFLILSSDGLHQYFTNEEAVAKVDSFITSSPDRDPAQLLINEALCRAAKKAGMDFHELLDIPQGERRLYHDDISIVIISFKGKIWRSSV